MKIWQQDFLKQDIASIETQETEKERPQWSNEPKMWLLVYFTSVYIKLHSLCTGREKANYTMHSANHYENDLSSTLNRIIALFRFTLVLFSSCCLVQRSPEKVWVVWFPNSLSKHYYVLWNMHFDTLDMQSYIEISLLIFLNNYLLLFLSQWWTIETIMEKVN